jgi:hypothetical protein
MPKVYKRTIYQITTNRFCAGVAVDQDGYVYKFDTAPCFKWAANKKMKFRDFLNFLKRKKDLISCKRIDEEVDPF